MTTTTRTFYEVRYQGAPYSDNESGELVSRHLTREAAEKALRALLRLYPARHHGNTRIVEKVRGV